MQTEWRVKISEMPLIVAKLVDYGINVHITQEYDNQGSVTDYIIIYADCCRGKWQRAIGRTPKWFPISLS